MKKLWLKIKSFLKNYFIKEKPIEVIEKPKKERKDLYPEITPGTIIRAKRNNKSSKNKLVAGHEEGPFLVVDKRIHGFICSYGTGIHSMKVNQYKISGMNYKLNKQTYFNVSNLEVISPKRMVKIMDKLSDDDFADYLKELSINKGNYYYFKKNRVNVKINNYYLSIGDVYFDGYQYLLIIDIYDNKYICLIFEGDYHSLNNLSYDNLIENKKTDLAKVVKRYDQKYIELVKEKYYALQSMDNTLVKRGSIIAKDNDLYYVYGEEGNNYLVFSLYKKENIVLDKWIVDNDIFYADYTRISTLSKKNDYQVIKQLNENKIDEIKKRKKLFNKQNKNGNMENREYGMNIKEGYLLQFSHDKFYYVYSQDEEHLYLVEMFTKKNNKRLFTINNIGYGSDFNKKCSVSKKLYYNVIGKLDNEKIEYIEELINCNYISNDLEINQEELKDDIIGRGSVIELDNHYYYIYGVEKEGFKAYELFLTEDSNMKSIRIKDYIYYTDFKDDIILTAHQDYNLLFNVSSTKMGELTRIKKAWIKNKKQIDLNTLEPGSIVYRLPDLKTKYLLVIKSNNLSTYIRYDEIKRVNAKLYYISDFETKPIDKIDSEIVESIVENNTHIQKINKTYQKIKK